MLKSQKNLFRILLSALVLATLPWAVARELQPDPSYAVISKNVARYFPRNHLSQMMADDLVAQRTWKSYLNGLDPEHMFFLQSDIDLLKLDENTLDDKLKAGDVSFAFKAYELYKKRLESRVAYVDKLLEKEFDLTVKESYTIKRKDAPWPADETACDELWRKRIKNEYLRHILAAEIKKEAAAAAATNTPSASTNATASVTNAPAPSAATNAAALAAALTGTVAKAEASTNQVKAAVVPPTPAELISKRYHQLLTINLDNDGDYVLQRYLTAFANAYDPHSSYMSPISMQDFDIDMKLSLVGIGALLSPEDGAAKIVRIIPGGPADHDKRDIRLQPGDKIIAVGQGDNPPEDILHLPLNKVVQKIRGALGSKVVMTVIPASDPSGSTVKTVDLIRDEVKLEEQAAKWKEHTAVDSNGVQRKIAVINLPAFYANMKATPDDPEYRSAADDVDKLLTDINKKGVDGLLLDLRNNGGGSLVDAIKMTGLFIPSGPVVQVKDAVEAPRPFADRDQSVSYAGPMIVLVNRLSASASEILAGALQDYGRAIIVGDSRTHGKGTVQNVVNVNKDPKLGSIKITTAMFYRIAGGSTQLRGVVSDIALPSSLDFMELGEDSLDNPVSWDAVPAIPFVQWDNLGPAISKLKALSEKRLETDKKFQAYTTILKRIEEIYKTEEVPLDIESRRNLAKAEKEITDLQEKVFGKKKDTAESTTKLTPDDDADNEEDSRNDVILEESMRILADFVAIKSNKTEEKPAAPAKKPDRLEQIMDWLRNGL